MTNEEDIINQYERILKVTVDMINSDLNILDGCQIISALLVNLDLHNDEDMQIFRKVDKEVKDATLSDVLLSPEKQKLNHKHIIEFYNDSVISACYKLIAKLETIDEDTEEEE